MKLNTPGQRDGLMQLWLDGQLASERTGLDWRGTYTGHALNAVFLEAYWNEGSPVTQTRWLDNFVISTNPIGPVPPPADRPSCSAAPHRRSNAPSGKPRSPGRRARSSGVRSPSRDSDKVTVDATSGTFAGPLAGQDRLAGDAFTAVAFVDRTGWDRFLLVPVAPGFRTAAE